MVGRNTPQVVRAFGMRMISCSLRLLKHRMGQMDLLRKVKLNIPIHLFGYWSWSNPYFKDEHLASQSKLSYDHLTDEWKLDQKTYYYYNQTTAYEPVDPISIEMLKMWPNPASGNVQFDLQEDASLHLYNPTGQLIRRFETSQGNHVLDVSGLPAGTYFVKAKSNDLYYTGRLVVQQL